MRKENFLATAVGMGFLLPCSHVALSQSAPVCSPATLALPSPVGMGADSMAGVVKQRVSVQSMSSHGAHFRVEQQGDVFHIAPAETRDANGNRTSHTPLFDTRISIPKEERSVLDTVQAVCDAVGSTAHVSVGPLMYPKTLLYYSRTVVGADKEPARTVLTRALMNKHLIVIPPNPDRTAPPAGPVAVPAAPPASGSGFGNAPKH